MALQGIPIYFLSLFKINQVMDDKIEKIQRHFLWSRIEDKNKLNLGNYEDVYRRKEKGGLGIRRFRDLSKALLTKVGWRLGENTTN